MIQSKDFWGNKKRESFNVTKEWEYIKMLRAEYSNYNWYSNSNLKHNMQVLIFINLLQFSYSFRKNRLEEEEVSKSIMWHFRIEMMWDQVSKIFSKTFVSLKTHNRCRNTVSIIYRNGLPKRMYLVYCWKYDRLLFTVWKNRFIDWFWRSNIC